jgi:hypothetical protein
MENTTAYTSDYEYESVEYTSEPSVIPPNHNITGMCGFCGGRVIQNMISITGKPAPREFCMKCGKRVKEKILPLYGSIREMEEED